MNEDKYSPYHITKIKHKVKVIICSDETEKAYFDLCRREYAISGTKVTLTIIINKSPSPVDILRRASEIRNQDKSIEIWAVFNYNYDADFDAVIVDALKKGIRCAFSNLKFEYWLLLHLKRVNRRLTNDELDKELESVLKIRYNQDPETLRIIYNSIFSEIPKAEERACEIHNFHSVFSTKKASVWCSCTTVYQLTRRMREWGKEQFLENK
jgi:hypothetical protein